MADRYWVGGTGTWGSSQTTNWSAATGLSFTASCTGTTLTTVGSPALVAGMTVFSSTHVSLGTIVSGSVNTWVVTVGGTFTSQSMSAATVGASVPTAADNVFFDANSNSGTTAFTCTMANTPRVCNDFTASGLDGVMTLAGTSIGLTVSGSLDWPATNFILNYTNITTFNATTTGKTITARVAFPSSVTFNGVGGGWTLGFALTAGSGAGTLTITNGTFDTSSSGNYAVNGIISSSNSNVRTINLNASTVTSPFSSIPVAFTTSTNLTFNAGTSTINCGSSSSLTFAGGGKTFYNVAFTSASLSFPSITGANTFNDLSINSTSISTVSITDANTFNNLSITGRTTIGIGLLSLSADQTINGTFTVSAGTASAYRIQISSDTIGTTRTLTCASIAAMTDVDFRDIEIAGAHGTLSGTRLGNCKGNTNITFPAAKTVYFGLAVSSGFWGQTGAGSWSATSGGAVDATQFPLAQDTAVFPATTYPANGASITIGTLSGNNAYNIGTIDMSLRTTNLMTLATSTNTPAIYGNWINGTGITISGGVTSILTFAGRTTQTVTSAGRSFTQPITINSVGGSVTLQDAFATDVSVATSLEGGTLDLNNFTLTTGSFYSSYTTTRSISFGTGSISCTGTGAVWSTSTESGLTTTGTQVVNVTSVGSTAISVLTGSLDQGSSISFNFTGGTYTLSFLNVAFSSARSINFTGYAGLWNPISIATIYGNLTLSTGMTLSSSIFELTFGATSGTKTITSNTKTMNFAIAFSGIGGTWACQDALTLGSTRALTMTNGTLQLKDGVTSTVGSFVTSGTTLKYLQSTTSGVQATLSDTSGTNTATYLSIQDSNATGGAVFTATSGTNVNVGNNSGWRLTYAAGITETATATDSGVVYINLFASITETSTATDPLLIASKTFNTFVFETATTTDVFIPSNIFWDIINNSQTITWTPTPTNTSTTWSLIDDSQTITWTPTPTNTSTTWVLVDDTAPTTWQNINN